MSRTKILAAATAALMLSAAPAFAQSACPALKQLAEVKLTRSASGQFLAPVTINGTKKQMLLATGVDVSNIRPSVAEELKLPLREGRTEVNVGSAPLGGAGVLSGQTGIRSIPNNDRLAHIDGFGLGTVQSGQGDLLVAAPDTDSDRTRAGALGMDILKHVDFDLDLGNSALNLFAPDHCAGQVVYWKTSNALALPFTYDSKGRIRIPVQLDGVTLNALVDTSETQDVVNLDVAKAKLKFSETGAQKMADQAGTGAKNYNGRFGKLSLDGIDISNLQAVVREDKVKRPNNFGDVKIGSSIRQNAEDNREPDFTLGLSTLSKLHIYVASKEMKLYISPASPAK